MTAVNTTTIVNEMQGLIEEAKADKKLDFEKRVKLIVSLTDRQLRAGALQLGYQRSIARLPEDATNLVPQLNSPDAGVSKSARQ